MKTVTYNEYTYNFLNSSSNQNTTNENVQTALEYFVSQVEGLTLVSSFNSNDQYVGLIKILDWALVVTATYNTSSSIGAGYARMFRYDENLSPEECSTNYATSSTFGNGAFMFVGRSMLDRNQTRTGWRVLTIGDSIIIGSVCFTTNDASAPISYVSEIGFLKVVDSMNGDVKNILSLPSGYYMDIGGAQLSLQKLTSIDVGGSLYPDRNQIVAAPKILYDTSVDFFGYVEDSTTLYKLIKAPSSVYSAGSFGSMVEISGHSFIKMYSDTWVRVS